MVRDKLCKIPIIYILSIRPHKIRKKIEATPLFPCPFHIQILETKKIASKKYFA